ncbi:hypothetical protein ACVWYQ_004736 [Bradyrhizobium sp. USDA 3397]
MKDFLIRAGLYGAFGIVALIGGLIFATVVITMVATTIGNLAIWPLLVAAIFNLPVLGPWIFGIAAAIALAIFLIAPHMPRGTEDKIGAVMSIGCFGLGVSVLLGFPLWFVLAQLTEGGLTGWAIIPCGVLTGGIALAWTMLRKPTS